MGTDRADSPPWVIGLSVFAFPSDAPDKFLPVPPLKAIGPVVACVLSAAVLYPLGRWMNRTRREVVVHPISGERVEVVSGGEHTLCGLQVEWWSIAWLGLGVFLAVTLWR